MSDPNSYPRESNEFQPVTVAVDGTPTTAVQLALTTGSDRPTVWADPVTVDGKVGVMTGGLTVGNWHVWAKVTSTPEVVVIDCGYFRIT